MSSACSLFYDTRKYMYGIGILLRINLTAKYVKSNFAQAFNRFASSSIALKAASDLRNMFGVQILVKYLFLIFMIFP